ncbi:MAG: hypothetical protein ACR2OZ_05730 [Verrucomicrobiales bacterium]
MAEIAENIVMAWQQAAREFGLQFTAPYHYVLPDERRANYLGLVHGFGRPRGTLLRVLQLGELSGLEPLDEHFVVAKLGSRHAAFHRWLFLETLREWGWCGTLADRPHWLE